jgi:hypothetical protein
MAGFCSCKTCTSAIHGGRIHIVLRYTLIDTAHSITRIKTPYKSPEKAKPEQTMPAPAHNTFNEENC